VSRGPLLVVLALASLVASCAEQTTASRGAKGGDGTLRLSLLGEPHTLNPNLGPGELSLVAGQNIFNRLVSLAPDGSILPELAHSWEMSDDGLRYSFHLRDDVTWHDGRRFTATDVRATLERVVLESSNRDLARHIAGVDIKGPHTVEVSLSEPWAAFLTSFAWYGTSILPAHIYGNSPWADHPANLRPIGTGPFKLMSWEPGRRIVIEKNDSYFGPGPYVDRVEYLLVKTSNEAIDLLLQGRADLLIGRPPAERLAELRKASHLNVTTSPADGRLYLGFNLTRTPFGDLRIRRAVNMALDRRALVENGLGGLGAPAMGFYTPSVRWAYNDAARVPDFDPAAARRAFSALLPSNYSAALVSADVGSGRSMAAELARQLEDAGLRVRIELMPPEAFLKRVMGEKDFDLALLSGAQGPDPDQLAVRFASNGTYQVMGYVNPEVDRALARGARSSDMAVRAAAYRRVQEILAADLPIAPLIESVRVKVFRKGLRGVPHEDARGLVPEFTYNLIRMPQR
jgi:peptide/nickel transport system substrate-binding protein